MLEHHLLVEIRFWIRASAVVESKGTCEWDPISATPTLLFVPLIFITVRLDDPVPSTEPPIVCGSQMGFITEQRIAQLAPRRSAGF